MKFHCVYIRPFGSKSIGISKFSLMFADKIFDSFSEPNLEEKNSPFLYFGTFINFLAQNRVGPVLLTINPLPQKWLHFLFVPKYAECFETDAKTIL